MGRSLSADEAERLQASHAKHFRELWDQIRPLPGARDLLTTLTAMRVQWAIATSGSVVTAKGPLGLLGIPEGTPIFTRDQVSYVKPNPDLFQALCEWGSCPEVTARRSWCERAPTGFTTLERICWGTWTSWGSDRRLAPVANGAWRPVQFAGCPDGRLRAP